MIQLKLLVDKRRNKVVFAECQSDFIDLLFSFLTLPLGVVVKLLDKLSGLGCMDKLYETVENLDTQYLQAETCKEMLLRPRSDMLQHCEDVLTNIKFIERKNIFFCRRCSENSLSVEMVSTVNYAVCSRGHPMNAIAERNLNGEKVCPLINGNTRSFLVLDNLFVVQASSDATFLLLKKFGIEDATMLEETTVELTKTDEFLLLLKRSLHSETPLTDIFLRQSADYTDATAKSVICSSMRDIKLEKDDIAATKTKQGATSESKTINLKVFESNCTNELIYIECDNDFVDLLFSFLTLPLGLIIFFIGKHSFRLGCINNIYKSVNDLTDDKEEILSVPNKVMLLKPKLACHFVCSNTVLKLDEAQPSYRYSKELNPKIPVPRADGCRGWEKGGGYARTCAKFMITKEMAVKPYSPLHSIQLMKDLGLSVGDLRQKSLSIGEAEALKLLQSCLTSSTLPNSSIFQL